MFLNLALCSGLLLTPLVLAVPSASVPRITRRSMDHQSRPNDYFGKPNGSVTDTAYSTNWAGAILVKNDNTFKSVTGTFTVPTPQGAQGSSAAAWVGLDGDSCKTAILQTGVDFTVSSNGPVYQAWYEWYPAPASEFTNIAFSAGDVVKLTVTASSLTSGTAMIENLTKKQSVTQKLTSKSPLCGQNAEWIVEDFMENNQQVPFANFGTVTFTNAEASGATTYTPSEATLVDISQNNKVLTSSSVSGSALTVKYL